MSLRRKLALTFAVVLLLVGVQTAVTVALLTQVVESSALLVGPALRRVDSLAHAEADVQRMRTLEHAYLSVSSSTERTLMRQVMADLQQTSERNIELYGVQTSNQSHLRTLDRILDGLRAYRVARAEVVDYLDRGEPEEALWAYLRFQPTFEATASGLHALRHSEYDTAEEFRDHMVRTAELARWPLGIVVVLVAAAEIWLAWYISGSVSRSLGVLQDGARRIAREDFEHPVPAPPERDLATLAETLNSVMGDLAAQRAERTRLEEERLRLVRERLGQVVRAQEEERARVSRELHDQAGQALTALHYGLARLEHSCHDPLAESQVAQLVSLAKEAARQIASLARDLRPAVLDDLGLVPALRSHVHEFSERVNLPVEFSVSGPLSRLNADAETAVFRVVQEALTNVAKHAHARHAWVRLALEDGELRTEVRDDGRGFDLARFSYRGRGPDGQSRGLGLAGIEERVRLLGGKVDVTSEIGKGTRIAVVIPARAYQPAVPQRAAEVVSA